jgi:hypothetical protein
MKISISIPDRTFQAADRAAKRRKISRSRFYTLAVESYLKARRSPDITLALNAVYAEDFPDPDLEFVNTLAYRTLSRNEW